MGREMRHCRVRGRARGPGRWGVVDELGQRVRRGADDERGDIITSWLLQLLVFLAVVAFVVYEVIAVVATTISLDDAAREVARAARDEYRADRSLDRATDAAEQVAELRDAQVVAVEEEGGELVVTVTRVAPTLVVHRIGPLAELAQVNATSRVGLAA
jgi:hypothetical protein